MEAIVCLSLSTIHMDVACQAKSFWFKNFVRFGVVENGFGVDTRLVGEDRYFFFFIRVRPYLCSNHYRQFVVDVAALE